MRFQPAIRQVDVLHILTPEHVWRSATAEQSLATLRQIRGIPVRAFLTRGDKICEDALELAGVRHCFFTKTQGAGTQIALFYQYRSWASDRLCAAPLRTILAGLGLVRSSCENHSLF